MRAERAGHTLQTTALVHEAYLRLAGLERMQFRDRAHFIAMAATMMRRVLVDYARAHARDKRGGGVVITSEAASGEAPQQEIDLLALDDALDRLARLDVQQARIVELRFFGGLTIDETARALEISPKTVTRDWAVAKAWLYHELTE
jgi:RNA polymerase sigma factor (TIGR02999 family)